MIIGTLLLTENDYYIDDRKNLPRRTTWDKALLTSLVSMNTITHKGYMLLPPSIQEVATIHNSDPSMAVTIKEVDALADLLMITRSARLTRGGKKFKFTHFKCILKEPRFEIWKRIKDGEK